MNSFCLAFPISKRIFSEQCVWLAYICRFCCLWNYLRQQVFRLCFRRVEQNQCYMRIQTVRKHKLKTDAEIRIASAYQHIDGIRCYVCIICLDWYLNFCFIVLKLKLNWIEMIFSQYSRFKYYAYLILSSSAAVFIQSLSLYLPLYGLMA